MEATETDTLKEAIDALRPFSKAIEGVMPRDGRRFVSIEIPETKGCTVTSYKDVRVGDLQRASRIVRDYDAANLK